EGLTVFADALDSSPSLRAVILDPQIDVSAKQRVVAALTEGADPLVANTLRLLLDKGRQTAIAEVCREYERLAVEEARVVAVEVTSAVELTPEAEAGIARRVEEATGKRPQLEKRVDAAIIGGLVLRVGDVIIDGSVRSRLRQLRERLLTADVRGGDQ
ncbi:MAG TPA: ATP synthase F1 subunit delta, partial [Thermoleophilia bacterium]|nr:ATP synthase F1 subunit delta [Thermoleophilia bacterium]